MAAPLPADFPNPVAGSMAYDTCSGELYVYDGSNWDHVNGFQFEQTRDLVFSFRGLIDTPIVSGPWFPNAPIATFTQINAITSVPDPDGPVTVDMLIDDVVVETFDIEEDDDRELLALNNRNMLLTQKLTVAVTPTSEITDVTVILEWNVS